MIRVIDLRSRGLERLREIDLGDALLRPDPPTVVIAVSAKDEFDALLWYPRIRRQDPVPSVPKMTPSPRPTHAGTWRASLGLALRCRSREHGRPKTRRAA